MGDDISITVIATGFEDRDAQNVSNVSNLVNRAWDKKISSIPVPTEQNVNGNDLDIPSFLRKNRGMNGNK